MNGAFCRTLKTVTHDGSLLRSAVMLAIFTILPFAYLVPVLLPKVELDTWQQ